jgi:nucleoside 2-deoxyribosyltransferase
MLESERKYRSENMKVFVAIKVPRGHAERTQMAQAVCQMLQDNGHDVFLAYWELEQRGISDPRQFMPLVREQIRRSDLMIILYDAELRGGLIEAGIAYAGGVPIWLAHRRGERVSSSALGCAEIVVEYSDPGDLVRQMLLRLSTV